MTPNTIAITCRDRLEFLLNKWIRLKRMVLKILSLAAAKKREQGVASESTAIDNHFV